MHKSQVRILLGIRSLADCAQEQNKNKSRTLASTLATCLLLCGGPRYPTTSCSEGLTSCSEGPASPSAEGLSPLEEGSVTSREGSQLQCGAWTMSPPERVLNSSPERGTGLSPPARRVLKCTMCNNAPIPSPVPLPEDADSPRLIHRAHHGRKMCSLKHEWQNLWRMWNP